MTYPTERLRRLRKTGALRIMVQETRLHSSSLIYPLFIQEGKGVVEEISSMPGISRFSPDRLQGPRLRRQHLPDLEDEACARGILVEPLVPRPRGGEKPPRPLRQVGDGDRSFGKLRHAPVGLRVEPSLGVRAEPLERRSLPEPPEPLSKDQERFLDRAIAQLTRECSL